MWEDSKRLIHKHVGGQQKVNSQTCGRTGLIHKHVGGQQKVTQTCGRTAKG